MYIWWGNLLYKFDKTKRSCAAVSSVMGEVLLTGIAVIMFSMLATMVFSLDGPVDSPHVAVETWARAPTDTISIRHCGGDVIDTDELKIIVSIEGSSYVYSQADLSECLNNSFWELGDVITINTNDKWSVSLTKGSPVYMYLVDTDSKQVFRRVTVIPGGGGSGGWLTPAWVIDDDLDGDNSNFTDILVEGDGSYTQYSVAKRNKTDPYSCDTNEEFLFDINMADYDYRLDEQVTNVKLKLVYKPHDNSFLGIRLNISDSYPLPGEWYIENGNLTDSNDWNTYVTDLSDRINTAEDVEGLRVRLEAVGNAADAAVKEINVDYIAVSFE
jgi:FlaG/FlaF family flagellin (archaellin)